MLRITESESPNAARNYFGRSLTRGDYYFDGQEIAGLWGGQGAERLGLSGALEKEAFLALLENKKPDGTPLTARTVSNRRCGYDFTFDVPKSVSMVHALGGDNRIAEAMRTAVAATMREMQEEMHARVRKSGAFTDRKTGNMVWADFTHLTSRPALVSPQMQERLLEANPWLAEFRDKNGGLALPDPHLHTHVYVLNATFDEVEDMWKAGEFMRLKRDATYYQAAYHARLAAELQKIGYEIEATAAAFEIAGVPRRLIEVFSRRTKEVEEAAKALGIVNPDDKGALGAKTRRGKNSSLAMTQLRTLWRSFIATDDADSLARISREAHTARQGLAKDSIEVARLGLRYGLGHELERVSVVSEKRLLARALQYAVGRSSVESVHKALRAEPNVVFAGDGGERRVTTPQILAEESALMAVVRGGRGRVASLAGLDTDAKRKAYRFRTPFLQAETKENKEQRDAVLHVLGSHDWIVGVVGRAGTGKTTLLQEIDAALKSQGTRLVLCAPTAEASRGVLRGEGFADAETVKRLLVDTSLQAKLKGGVLWIDEAGMIGNRDMLAVLKLAKDRGVSRVVLAGDPTQIRSVPRGDAFLFLEKEAGLSVARLENIRRQKTPELKAAVEAISRGNVATGLEILSKDGKIQEADAFARSLATAYVEKISRSGRQTTALVVCPTHREGETITTAIRAELRAKRKITAPEQKVLRTVNLAWTENERTNPANYDPGLVVQFKQHAKGFRRGERVRVEEVDYQTNNVRVLKNDGTETILPLAEAKKFQVYTMRAIDVAVGDQLKITENGYDQTGKFRLNNGDLVTVSGFTPEGGIVLENQKVLPRHFGHLNHGYVVTADAAQSKTVDVVYAAIGRESLDATDTRRVYVAISRAREEAWVFTDDKDGLIRAAQRDTVRQSATEVVGVERSLEIVRQFAIREAHRHAEQARHTRQVVPQRQVPLVLPEPSRNIRRMEMEYGR